MYEKPNNDIVFYEIKKGGSVIKIKKNIQVIFFLIIGFISILSFILLEEKNCKLLIWGGISLLVAITELFATQENTSLENSNKKYADRAAQITTNSTFFLCITWIIILFIQPNLIKRISSMQVLEIIAGYIGTCYLLSYFIKAKRGKHDEKQKNTSQITNN